ncbi:MAG TPA: PEGA domain-containing protein [Polyangiaceae bacterium]|nr:PEGA domain-containing protein [Polyangiaceae bacterium]
MKRLREGNWNLACPAFEASLACHARASTQTKVAACRDHDGRLVEALTGYRQALELEKNPTNASALDAEIRDRIERLERRIPRLVVFVEPLLDESTVTLDEKMLSNDDVGKVVRVDPGTHRVVVKASGYREEQADVTVAEGDQRHLRLQLVQVQPGLEPTAAAPTLPPTSARNESSISPAGERAPAAPTDDPQAGGSRPLHTASLLVGGMGVVTLGVAGYFALRTHALVEEAEPDCGFGDGTCNQTGLDRLDGARRAQTAGLVLGGVGVAALGAGVVMLVADRPSPHSSRSMGAWNVGPSWHPFGIVAQGAF